MATRAGLYLRISLDRTGEGLAVDRQRQDGEQLIRLRGWELTETYTDNDISAAGGKTRPGFEALLQAVQDKQLEIVVAWSLDRLTRNRRDQLRLIETCHAGGANLALVRGSDMDLSSAVGRAVADILSTTARLENEQKAERQVRAIRQAAEQGRMIGGRRAFGYSPDGLHFDPAELPMLKEMYQRFAHGVPLGSIARWLNEQGVTTTQGNRWKIESVRVVLANPRNAGLRAVRSVDPRTGKRGFYHDEPVGTANWPAAVEQATWARAVRELQDPVRRTSSSNRNRYLLSGLARCGYPGCDSTMVTSWNHGVRLLRCRASKHVSRRADVIEVYAVTVLMMRLARPDAATLFAPPAAGFDLDAIREQVTAGQASLRTLTDDFHDPKMRMGRAEYTDARERIQARLDVLDAQIAAAGSGDVLAPLRTAPDPQHVWDQLGLETQREVLRQVMTVTVNQARPGQPGGIRFDPETVEVVWC